MKTSANYFLTPFFIIIGLVVIYFSLVLIIYLIGFISKWHKIAEEYPSKRLDEPNIHFGSVQFGWVGYNNCVRIGFLDDGLYLALPFPIHFSSQPILIPYQKLVHIKSGSEIFGMIKFEEIEVRSKSGVKIQNIKIYSKESSKLSLRMKQF
ncbi:MAG: hypothetical protein SFU98_05815 [Leptospiraceae bacterium]|nr:hypothetical protein [Leptospiraceae bacterium]